jgi:hypothetical protein
MKNKITYILISVLLNTILLSFVRGYLRMDFACILSIILYFSFTFLVFKNLKKERIIVKLIIILIGTIIVHVPMRIIDFKSQIVSFPEFICELIGVLMGILYYFLKGKMKVIPIILATIITSYIYLNYNKVLEFINFSNVFYKNTKSINIDKVQPHVEHVFLSFH